MPRGKVASMTDADGEFPFTFKRPKLDLRAALTGGVVCGMVGPLIGVAIAALRDRGWPVADLLFGWFVAVLAYGLPGFVLGAVGAHVLRYRSARVRFSRVMYEALAIGVAFGALVPFGSWMLGWGGRESIVELLPTALIAGVSCSVIVALLLRNWNLLRHA